jgi:integrase
MPKHAKNILPIDQNFQKPNTAESILDDLPILNENKRIKIRARHIPTIESPNRHSLFLDISKDGKREKRYIRVYVDLKRNSKRMDKESVKIAITMRDKLEVDLFKDESNFRLTNRHGKSDFLAYFKLITDSKDGGSLKPYLNAYKQLKNFTNDKVTFNDVNKQFCLKFRDYLLTKVSQNTAHTYFSRLKAVLNMAVEYEYIRTNPSSTITISKTDTKREFLNIDEIRKLQKTSFHNKQTTRAFLFSCYTGLRFSDIKSLTFDNIQGEYLVMRQQKTKGAERMKLSKNAKKIIQIQKKEQDPGGLVFDLFGHDYTLKQIKQWVQKAKIKKHITWHSGRHTFATLALTYDTDLYTVSKLLGHREIRSTQIYAKLIDKKKDEAIDNLPEI